MLLAALAAAYMAWIRDASFVRVQKVTVTGLSTPRAGRLRAQLTTAALGMTTLHVDEDALRRAVAGDPLVRTVDAVPSFPHDLRIAVGLGVPVAALASGGQTVAVASDGTLLPGLRAGALPVVALSRPVRGTRLGRGPALDLVAAAAGAPSALRPTIASMTAAPGQGAVAHLRGGPSVLLGDGRGLDAKWAAASAVLAAPSSQGASYIDVRDPTRPVAGGLGSASRTQSMPAPLAAGGAGPSTIPANPASDGTSRVAPGAVVQSTGAASGTPQNTQR
ncbi:MAG: hypothetical protein NVSMB25_13020 [Thermoleophilaceae bacterium]